MLRRDWNDLLTRHYTTFPHYSRVRAQQAQIRKKIQVNVYLGTKIPALPRTFSK